MFIGFALAGIVGPNIASYVNNQSKPYVSAFVVAMVLCGVDWVDVVAQNNDKRSREYIVNQDGQYLCGAIK